MLKSALALVVVGLLAVTKASTTDHWEERELQIPEDELSLAEEDYGGNKVYCTKFESIPMGKNRRRRRRLTASQEVTCALKRITHCTGEVEDCTTPKHRSTTGGTCAWNECDASRSSKCENGNCMCSLDDITPDAPYGKRQESVPEGAVAVKGACEACKKEDKEKIERDACTSCKPAFLQCNSYALQDYISAREQELKDVLNTYVQSAKQCNRQRQRAFSGDTGGTCSWWDCDSSRGAKCNEHGINRCMCNMFGSTGQCAVGGKCVSCSDPSIPTCTTEEAAVQTAKGSVTAYTSLNTTAKAEGLKAAHTSYTDATVSQCNYGDVQITIMK